MERITTDAAYALPTVQFLNDLAYVKDKSRYDEIEFNKMRKKHKQ